MDYYQKWPPLKPEQISVNYFDIVLHPIQRLRIMFLPPLTITTCKLILKERIKGLTKGTAQYAEIVDLGKAVHALEKSQRYIDLSRQAIVDVLNEVEKKSAISADTKALILANLAHAMNTINVQIENEFAKPKTASTNENPTN